MLKIIKILILLVVLGGIYTIYELGFSECGDWYVRCQTENQSYSLEGEYEFSIKDEAGEETYVASLDIENISTSSFMFNISVAAQGGVGEIKGEALILDSKKAKASIVENNVSCELAFEVTKESEPQTMEVTENSSGCLQFHGASVQFEHSYVKRS